MLRLVVSDGAASDSDTVVVVASTAVIGPTRPAADAGPDQTVVQGATVMLDGTGSSDPNGDPLTYLWAFADWPGAPGDPAPTLSDATSETPSFVAAVDGVYVLRLTVSDGAEDSIPDAVTVTASAGGGACADPLTLVTPLPFQPMMGEVASVIQIDGDDLRVVPSDMPLDIDAIEARIPNPADETRAEFVVRPLFEEISRSHPNPISESESPSFVIRHTLDDVYYKLDVAFTGDADLDVVQIDALSACRCGNDPGNCPP